MSPAEVAALLFGLTVGIVLLAWFVEVVSAHDASGITLKDFVDYLRSILRWLFLLEVLGGGGSIVGILVDTGGIWWYLIGLNAVFFPLAFVFFFGRYLLRA